MEEFRWGCRVRTGWTEDWQALRPLVLTGPDIPEERVLNRKQPLNFVLEEPTLLKYIDPTMALDNFGALQLLTCDLPAGLNLPTPEQEEEILRTVREAGEITAELDGLEAMR